MTIPQPPPEITDHAGRVWRWDPGFVAYRHDHPHGTDLATAEDLTTVEGNGPSGNS